MKSHCFKSFPKLAFSVGVTFLGCGVFLACNHGSPQLGANPNTLSANKFIIGTWKITEVTRDTNNNGRLDEDEKMKPDSLLASNTYTFRTDGTEVYDGDTSDVILWRLTGGNSFLEMASKRELEAHPDAKHTLKLNAISATTMEVEDTAVSQKFRAVLRKQ